MGGRLENINNNIINSNISAVREVLNLYGGMGSINDIVLYGNMGILVNENDEFNYLRTKLFNACNDLI